MPVTKALQREELAEVDVDWLIVERPGKVRTWKQHPRKNKNGHQHRIHESQHPGCGRWSNPFLHHQATVRLPGKIQGVAEKR